MVVVSFVVVDLDVAVIGIVVDLPHVGISPISPVPSVPSVISVLLTLEVVSKCRVLSKGKSLEFPIGVEAEDHHEEVVSKADDGDRVDVLFLAGVGTGRDFVLYGSQEVDHEGDREEDADEDVQHQGLVAAAVLGEVQHEEQDQPEQCLSDELLVGDEVEDDDQHLRDHEHGDHELEGLALLGVRDGLWPQAAQAHLNDDRL